MVVNEMIELAVSEQLLVLKNISGTLAEIDFSEAEVSIPNLGLVQNDFTSLHHQASRKLITYAH